MYAQLAYDIEHEFQSPVEYNIIHAEHMFKYYTIDQNNLKITYTENKIQDYIEGGSVDNNELEQAKIKMEELQLEIAMKNLPKLWPQILEMVEDAEAEANKKAYEAEQERIKNLTMWDKIKMQGKTIMAIIAFVTAMSTMVFGIWTFKDLSENAIQKSTVKDIVIELPSEYMPQDAKEIILHNLNGE